MTAVESVAIGGPESPDSQATPILRSPPRWVFHAVVSILAVILLASVSTPGGDFFIEMPAAGLLVVAAVVWLVRVVVFVVRRVEHTSRGSAWWFAVAPLGGALVLALMLTNVPLRARWAASEGAFKHVLSQEQIPAHSRRIGFYTITSIEKVDDGVLFYEATGALFDTAGFAYLPHGPYPALANGIFENPHFVHLHGPWYAWTASW